MKKIHKAQLELIEKKQKELDEIKAKLKGDFVGLDHIIDTVCESIKVWYIFPELQIRPTIVCLWGMTGVGKTDLVRKLVSYMRMQDRFLEIEMGDGYAGENIQTKLETSALTTDDQCIVFLDEFQRFRTVDDQGGDVEPKAYGDVWTLLSDGKFQVDLSRKSEIVDSLLYSKYYEEQNEFWESAGSKKEKVQEKKKREMLVYKTPVYTARKLKKTFKLQESLEEIMKFDEVKINKLYDEASKNPQIFEPEPFKKMLIVVSGNLDEAYRMAKKVEDADVDADFYHAMSKKITIVDIKASLVRRFKPEQIARLGNTHVLYPCLSKRNYEDIIVLKCNQIRDVVEKLKDVKIQYDPSVYGVMYRNGVFPTQGVRPLLSTITNILSCALPNFLFDALKCGQEKIDIRYEDGYLISEIGGVPSKHEVPTVLEEIKEGISIDVKTQIAVHELGHAVVHSLLYGTPPAIICSTSISPYVDGFVIQNNNSGTKANYMRRLRVAFGGIVAEELVFGKSMVGAGAASDLQSATDDAFEYVCFHWFDEYRGKVSTHVTDCDTKMAVDKEVIGMKLQVYLEAAYNDTVKLLKNNLHVYQSLLQIFLTKDELTSNDFISVFAEHGIVLKSQRFDEVMTPNYGNMALDFLSKTPKKSVKKKKNERSCITGTKIPVASIRVSGDAVHFEPREIVHKSVPQGT